MKKILYLPLDERPCNWTFPKELFSTSEVEITAIPENLKGYKKRGSDVNLVRKFVKENAKKANGLVISLDMLIYGGLIPSRLHYETKETLLERLTVLEEIKREMPEL
ncbi:MAG TPA: DUF4127 family protein, partial [Bacilli bacterium]|nr:DUF4127 family protein [Bacilli bacterium]